MAALDPQRTSLRRARWALIAVAAANLAVALAKIAAGSAADSAAVRADGFHSLVDASASLLGLAAVAYALRPPDRSHAYGHRKVETLASLGIVALLAVLIVEIVRDAVGRLQTGAEPQISVLLFAVMIGTLAVNVAVAVFARRAGRACGSDFLIADANQTAADVLVSAGVLVGIGLAASGVPHADAAASLVVAAAVAVIGVRIVRRGAAVLLDAAIIPDRDIASVVLGTEGVRSWHKVRTRGRADEVFVDLHIEVDPQMTVRRGHRIAHAVEDAIGARFPQVADVTVHVEPAES